MKNTLSMLLVLVLLVGGISVHGASAPGTYYQLDTGVVFLWKEPGGAWQYGLEPGKAMSSGYSLNIAGTNDPRTIENVTVVPYKSDFLFAELQNFSWNPNSYATDQLTYNREYYYDKSINMTGATPSYDSNTGLLTVTWNGQIPTNIEKTYDVKAMLDLGLSDEIYSRMGFTRDTAPAFIREKIEEYDPIAGASSSVKAYMFFAPTIIKYEIVPAARPLKKPLVDVECGDPTMPGSKIQVGGVIKNPNDYDVGMIYSLSVNGVAIKSDTLTLKAGRGYGAYAAYNVSPKAKPGSKLRVVLTATIWDPLDATKKASASDSCDVYVVATDTEFDGGLQPSEIVD